MPPEAGAPEEFVVLASLTNRREAERTVHSFGHKLRRKARSGHGSALVVSGNPDGSLKLTQARAVTASGVTAALLHASVSWTVGLMGLFSLVKAVLSPVKACHIHEGHVGSGEHAAHALLAEAGPDAALVLVRCDDRPMWEELSARAADRDARSWRGSMSDFLGSLEPEDDWVRKAVGAPTS
jgi:hypothetical protein